MSNLTVKKTALAPWMKIAATGGILLGAAAIVGSGAFAVWTSSATATSSINAGSVNISLSNSNIELTGMAPGDTVQQLLTIGFPQTAVTGNAVSGIKLSVTPGTVAQGTETLGVNLAAAGTAGSNDLSGGSLYSGSAASIVSDVAYPDGTFNLGADLHSSALTYKIETCSIPWTKATPTSVYVCTVDDLGVVTQTAGGATTVLNSMTTTSPLTLAPSKFDALNTTTSFAPTGGAVSLYSMISITLPWSANNSFAGSSVALTFNASAVQRDAITTAP
jgi:hypothetical protein